MIQFDFGPVCAISWFCGAMPRQALQQAHGHFLDGLSFPLVEADLCQGWQAKSFAPSFYLFSAVVLLCGIHHATSEALLQRQNELSY